MISPVPDIRTHELDPKLDSFVFLACDGIWNSLSSQEVADFIAERLQKADKHTPEELKTICVEVTVIGDSCYFWLASWVCRRLWNENQFVNHVDLFQFTAQSEIKYLATKSSCLVTSPHHNLLVIWKFYSSFVSRSNSRENPILLFYNIIQSGFIFDSFSNIQGLIQKSNWLCGVLGIWTWGHRLYGANKSTELLKPYDQIWQILWHFWDLFTFCLNFGNKLVFGKY